MVGFDLEPVRELVKITESFFLQHAQPRALNHPSGKHVDVDMFTRLTSALIQARELVGNFDEFRQECEDFASGNLQMYIDDYREKHPGRSREFDPFDDLFERFNPDHTYAFVKDIRQFAELVRITEASKDEHIRHCLDGYNAFIAQWYEIVYRYYSDTLCPDGRACAAELLAYYHPRHADTI
ncbi:hypothetical protein [Larkinella punicea]|uniref:Uncharacterized protein n=1 Tax=Larkinella punicea TaxID=2315727 RepID=A0A368JKV9_9BACT|nr:hypothetical protein [Larkinella punicea]RCR68300.1 hypothetical protein DUE52_18060 [Larkinella punicea]